MKDRNEFRFSGTVEQFRQVETRTGTPMVAFSVRCWKEVVRCVAFKSIAEQTTLAPGDRIEVRGHIQSNTWTDKEGNQRSGWQVIAHEIHLADDDQQDAPPATRQRQEPPPEPRQQDLFPGKRRDTGDDFAYQGGPF